MVSSVAESCVVNRVAPERCGERGGTKVGKSGVTTCGRSLRTARGARRTIEVGEATVWQKFFVVPVGGARMSVPTLQIQRSDRDDTQKKK